MTSRTDHRLIASNNKINELIQLTKLVQFSGGKLLRQSIEKHLVRINKTRQVSDKPDLSDELLGREVCLAVADVLDAFVRAEVIAEDPRERNVIRSNVVRANAANSNKYF